MTDPLLRTKLYISPLRSEIVPRPRLIERLDTALGRKFTLLSAPAGFGKTTLLREWISNRDLSTAWFSMDKGDNDPNRFWTYVVAALQTVEPQFGVNVLAALQTPQPAPIESLLVELINEIAGFPSQPFGELVDRNLVLILDDYHLITESRVHDSLYFFLDHLPPLIHLVISSRSDPPWPMASLRARRMMTELRAEDLRFSSQEVTAFLNAIMKLDISPADVAALEKHTEGWIVGLQMAALSMQKRSDISAFVQAFTGTHRFILDYLLEEVLDQQLPEYQEFLLKTSLLDQMNAQLCDAILDRSDSHAILAQLEQANLFLIPLDDQRKWYRYHHLFSELLRNQSALIYPEEVRGLHSKASQWLEEQDFIDETIAHAFAAHDYQRVARLCEKFAREMLQQQKHKVLYSWIEALPPELVEQRPWLCVYQAWTRHWAGMRAGGETCIETAERVLESDSTLEPDQRNLLAAYTATVRAHYALVNERLAFAIKQAESALRLLPKEDYYARSTAGIALGGAYWGKGKVALAEQAFKECASTAIKGGYTYRASSALCYAGMQQVKQSKLKGAEKTFRQALSFAQGPGGQQYPIAGYPLVKLGELACEWDCLDQSREYVEKGMELCVQLGNVDLIAEAYVSLARVQLAWRDEGGLQATLQQAEELSIETKLDPWVHTWLDEIRIRAWLSAGNLHQATHWLESAGLDDRDEFNYHHDLQHINLARVLVAQLVAKSEEADRDRCLKLLARLLRVTDELGWLHHKIQVLILQAMAFLASHNQGAALHALKQALSLAEPGGYIRIFTSEGGIMGELLQPLTYQGKVGDYASDLLRALVKSDSSLQIGLVEPLTPRELEVLEFLITSLSVPEIAKELVISTHTVRTHIKNIYSKLGVNRRLDAIQAAKEHNLI